jgi:predicted enzyme related to lactoylglutathione lyase
VIIPVINLDESIANFKESGGSVVESKTVIPGIG